MSRKRLRVFAGPNGSGKSTITAIVHKDFDLGVYVNADEINRAIETKGVVDFGDFQITLNAEVFLKGLKARYPEYVDFVEVSGNSLLVTQRSIGDYLAMYIADYLREELLKSGKKFSFETVMSHPSKLEFMKKAKLQGYKVYLYFVTLRDPELNVMRVQGRVKSGGHNVPQDKIIKRYGRCMEFLYEAIRIADNAYLFDNSAGEHKMIATVIDHKMEILVDYYPQWFKTYFWDKLK